MLNAPRGGPSSEHALNRAETAMIRVAYLVTHPIQYQAPLLRRIAKEPGLDFTVFFRSDLSISGAIDPGFGIPVKWDVDLLQGYRSHFLPTIGDRKRVTFWRPFNYGLTRELRRGRFDVLWVHGYGAVYHLYAMLVGRILGLKVMLRDEAHQHSRVRVGLGELRARLIYAFLRRVVDCFLAIGIANGGYYRFRDIAPERIFLVPYTVDNVAFAPNIEGARDAAKISLLEELGLPGPRTIVLFASKLQERKRCLDLLEAFLRLDADQYATRPLLVIAGDGEERSLIEARIAEAGRADDVRLIGFVNQSALPRIYQASDIFVLPSYDEPWGLAINEAMSAGCAILASKEIGAVRDLVSNGVNGFTFPAGDVGSLNGALNTLLQDPARAKTFGDASRLRIKTWDFEADIRGLRKAVGI